MLAGREFPGGGGGGGGVMLRALAAGVVLVLAAAAAPDESHAQGAVDLRFAVPVRDANEPGSPVLARLGALSAVRGAIHYDISATGATGYTGVGSLSVRLFDAGSYQITPGPTPGASVRQQMENQLVLLLTRLNSAGDGLFAQNQDTFVLEPLNWGSTLWSVGSAGSGSPALAARITAALGSASARSQWYLILVDETVSEVHIDETAQRFLYGSLAPPVPPVPPPPAQVTGVRVSPLDGGLRVSWSAAAGPVDVSQYRVDVADAAGERVRRVYTEADVFEAVVDGLANGVEYTVTVRALPGHGGENGPPSEARTATPGAGGDTEDVPVPALPLAGAGALAGLLASAAYRFRMGLRSGIGRRTTG